MANRIIYCFLVVIAVSSLRPVSFAETGKKEAPGASTKIFVSFLWAGKSDTECRLRDTLLADTEEDCLAEYSRVEDEVKKLVKSKNEKGAGWKWGVFAKCAPYADTDTYNQEMEKLQGKCKGK